MVPHQDREEKEQLSPIEEDASAHHHQGLSALALPRDVECESEAPHRTHRRKNPPGKKPAGSSSEGRRRPPDPPRRRTLADAMLEERNPPPPQSPQGPQ